STATSRARPDCGLNKRFRRQTGTYQTSIHEKVLMRRLHWHYRVPGDPPPGGQFWTAPPTPERRVIGVEVGRCDTRGGEHQGLPPIPPHTPPVQLLPFLPAPRVASAAPGHFWL